MSYRDSYRDRRPPIRPRSRSPGGRSNHNGSSERSRPGPGGRGGRGGGNDSSTMRSMASEVKRTDEWIAGEDEFMLKQKKEGAVIRVKDGRAAPIDYLTALVQTSQVVDDDDTEFDVKHPATIFDSISTDAKQLRSIVAEAQEFGHLESKVGSRQLSPYWKAVSDTAQYYLQSISTSDDPDNRVVQVVAPDIENVLQDLSGPEMTELETQVREMLANPEVDSDYWSRLLKELLTKQSKQELSAFFDKVVEIRIERYKQVLVKRDLHAKLYKGGNSQQDATAKSFTDSIESERKRILEASTVPVDWKSNSSIGSNTNQSRILPAQAEDPLMDGRPEPKSTKATRSPTNPAEIEYERDSNSATPSGEEEITEIVEEYSGKDPSQRPLFVSRAQVGFEWNRYNQTHYSADDPPPKSIQGYKFNLYFPKLVGSKQVPSYKVVREGGSTRWFGSETCILVFKSPAHYQDVAFRILDKQWDKSPHQNAGYHSRFENGVLRLHFRFRRMKYNK